MELFSEKTKNKIIFTVGLCILAPLYIAGKLCFALGKFISAFRFIFWLEPTDFIKEIKKVFTNIKYTNN